MCQSPIAVRPTSIVIILKYDLEENTDVYTDVCRNIYQRVLWVLGRLGLCTGQEAS